MLGLSDIPAFAPGRWPCVRRADHVVQHDGPAAGDHRADPRLRLLGDLAHELRTPLASIEATIEAVTDGILPSDQSTLATLTEQSQRLPRLVGDLSAVSRAEERQLNLTPVLVPLQDVVSAAAAGERPPFDAKGIAFSEEGVSPWQVLVDPDRLAEALGALVDKALRHTPRGGTVAIVTTGHDNRCRIVVSDTGERFDPAVATRLFERFYWGDCSRTARGAGSGIGLTIVKAIVKAHNGQLLGHSDGPGKGAQFEITLPIAGRSHARPSTRLGRSFRSGDRDLRRRG